MGNPTKIPANAKILAAGGKKGTGNVLFLYDRESPPRVLKVYRTRRSRFREGLRSFSQIVFEGKQGSSPRARRATEKKLQAAWREAGLEVVHILSDPVPEDIKDPALWLEYFPCPDLLAVLTNPETQSARRTQLLRQLGKDTGVRQKLAVEVGNPFLLHEHATLNHFFVDGDRLVAFDMENGYRKGFPPREAAVQELSTLLRSISRLQSGSPQEDLRAFLAGYEDRELLKELLRHGSQGQGLRRRFKRWYDRKTRPGKSKTEVLVQALDLISRG